MEKAKEVANNQEVRQTAVQCAYLTLSYPLDFARTLMQLGYEPFPPTERTFIFGAPYLALPNTFQYLKYIKSVDGFFGCYRGLGPRICQSIISQAVHKQMARRNPFNDDRDERDTNTQNNREQINLGSTRSGALIRGSQVAEDFVSMAKHTGWEIMSVTVATIASQPFYVIAVRTMAQFVGRETKYNTIFEAIQTIFWEDGLLGFFRGLTPRLVGEAIYISLSASLVYLISSYIGRDGRGPIEAGTMMLSNVVSSSFTYQFVVVSSVMAVNNSNLAVGHYPFTKQYGDWYECWRSLAEARQLKRGSSIIGRYYTGPTIVINGAKRPTSYYFGPLHPTGLGLRERACAITPMYPPLYSKASN